MKLAIALALTLTAAAQTPKYEVHRAPSKIIVDGRATDPAWAAAAPAIEFIFPWEKRQAKDHRPPPLGQRQSLRHLPVR